MRSLKYFSLLMFFQMSLSAQTYLQNSLDSLIIDPDTIDINQFSISYKFWVELEAINPDLVGNIVVSDFNNNGYNELYSGKVYSNIGYNAVIFELDSFSNFNLVYNFPDTVRWAVAKYDIDGNGKEELILNSLGSRGISVYSQDDTSNYPTTLDFFFSVNPDYQINSSTFGDFDNDGKTDYAFWADASPRFLGIYEFNSISNNFDSVFTYYPMEYSSGIIVGDFDKDNKTELIISSENGGLEIIENNGDNIYNNTWKYDTHLFNAYYKTSTNDFNKNGFNEFWLLGDDLGNNEAELICFEFLSDNNYAPIYKVIIKNTSAIGYAKLITADINYDGVEEVIVCLGNQIFFLNFSQLEQKINVNLLYYFKLEGIGGIYNISFYDVEKKGHFDMFVSHSNRYTKIYKADGTSNINENENLSVSNFNIMQNYPNPFNPSTNIKFSIPERSEVKIKVYNSLGEEIITLLNQALERGEHTIVWNGTDKNNSPVPTGVYFISMEAKSFHKTIKSILLK